MQWCRKKNLAQAEKKLPVPTKLTKTAEKRLLIMPGTPRQIKNNEASNKRIDAWETAKQKVIEKREEIKRDIAKKLYVSSNEPSSINFACRHDTAFSDVMTAERVKAGWEALRQHGETAELAIANHVANR
jgi:hypothetical protein